MARFNHGYIKLYRMAVVDAVGGRGNFTLGIFVRLLQMANWRPGGSLFGGKRVELKPGQLITGLRELSPDTEEDPHLHRARGALTFLEKRGTIAQATCNQGRLITIVNWDFYQNGFDEDSMYIASEAQADRKQSDQGPQLIEEEELRKKKEERKNTARTSVRATYSPEFEGIWEAYGRVGKKADASKAFEESRFSLTERTDLLRAIAHYLADCRKKERTQMYLGTFLREDWRIWLEAPIPVALLEEKRRKDLDRQMAEEQARVKAKLQAEEDARWADGS